MNTALTILGLILALTALIAVYPRDIRNNIGKWLPGISKNKNRLLGFNLKRLFDILKIEDIIVGNTFIRNPLKQNQIVGCVDNTSSGTITSPHILSLRDKIISETEALAIKDGLTFDNNASFALQRIDIKRPEGTSGERENVYKIITKKTDFFSFVFPNLVLDREVYNENTQENDSVRNIVGLQKSKITFDNLIQFPQYSFKIGVGTLLISSDNYIVCSIRSKKQFIASANFQEDPLIHLSAAEGMFRSSIDYEKSDMIDGQPNPFATCYRSITDELNIPVNLVKDNVRSIGYFLDLKRAQPFFIFYCKAESKIDHLLSYYNDVPKDIHENNAIFAIKWNIENIISLFKKVTLKELNPIFPDIFSDYVKSHMETNVKIASNHAMVGFSLGMWNDFDKEEILSGLGK